MGIAAFLIVIQSLITFVHYVVWSAMQEYWPLSSIVEPIAFSFFIAISFSYLATNILTRFFPSPFTRILYLCAAIWLGTVHFLFLAAVVTAFFSFAAELSGLVLSPWTAGLIFAYALGLNAWSLWRGFRIRSKHLTVALPNLPEHWIGKKIAFFADSHFGNIHREQSAENIVQLIEAENPSLILMGGDFFDGPPIDPAIVTKPFEKLTKRIPTYFVSGNHEEYGDTIGFLRSLQSAGFRVINDKCVEENGLQLVGLDFVTTRTPEATEMVMMHLHINEALPTIVLKHIPRNIPELVRGGAHLTLHGHTHEGQMWPFSLVTGLVYKGYDFGLNRYGEALVYTTSGAGSWGPPQRFATYQEVVFLTLERKE